MTIIEDYTRVEKIGDDHFFVTRYKEKIDPEIVVKRVKFLEANIKTLKEGLDLMSVKEGVKALSEKLEVDREVKKEALRNFDKYISDRVLDIKRKKEKNRKAIRDELLGFDEYKTKQLELFRKQLEEARAKQENQLYNDTKQLRAYNGETVTAENS